MATLALVASCTRQRHHCTSLEGFAPRRESERHVLANVTGIERLNAVSKLHTYSHCSFLVYKVVASMDNVHKKKRTDVR
jgi:hypothetical protein